MESESKAQTFCIETFVLIEQFRNLNAGYQSIMSRGKRITYISTTTQITELSFQINFSNYCHFVHNLVQTSVSERLMEAPYEAR